MLITKYSPINTLKESGRIVLRSSLFWAFYVALFRYMICFFKNTRHRIDRWNVVMAALISTFAIFFEPSYRRTELAIYLIPRFLEGLWTLLQKKGYVKSVEYGEVLIFSIAMGIIMYCFHYEEGNIKSTYLSVFKKFWTS